MEFARHVRFVCLLTPGSELDLWREHFCRFLLGGILYTLQHAPATLFSVRFHRLGTVHNLFPLPSYLSGRDGILGTTKYMCTSLALAFLESNLLACMCCYVY